MELTPPAERMERNSGVYKHARDRAASHLVSDVPQCTLNSGISPGEVFLRKTHNKFSNGYAGPRSTGGTFSTAAVLAGDELAVPSQQCVRSNDRHDATHCIDSGCLCLGGEAPPLSVSKARFPAKLLAENSNFLLQILDQELLILLDSSGQEQQAELPKCSHLLIGTLR